MTRPQQSQSFRGERKGDLPGMLAILFVLFSNFTNEQSPDCDLLVRQDDFAFIR